ncbi:MAG: hypothetical protein CVT76_02130 [Alphaproteobacteria bacterium HGW-Alphaproteobacteria-15]|nr:MAG: hypothetical protein CVT76_02130 [Alphaproteobacteria bacterium HGW-Alphaproteobacteria-15]
MGFAPLVRRSTFKRLVEQLAPGSGEVLDARSHDTGRTGFCSGLLKRIREFDRPRLAGLGQSENFVAGQTILACALELSFDWVISAP